MVYGNDPNYRVKSKEPQLHGYSVEGLKKERGEIYARRATQPQSKQLEQGKQTHPQSKQLQQGKQSLKSTPPKQK